MLFLSGKKHLFVGFGGLASQCTEHLLQHGDQVVGVSRGASRVVTGMTHWQGDVRSEALQARIASARFDSAIITLSPDGRGADAYRRSYYDISASLLNVWQHHASPPARIIFISSTSVYGQTEGEIVDEYSPTYPRTDTGSVLAETEALYLRSPLPTSIVRFSGIYGPGRDYLLRQVLAGKGGDDSYTNRIHVDDCCGVMCHLLAMPKALEPIYLASDKRPVKSHEIRVWLAEQLGLDPGALIPSETVGRGGNKRCVGQLLEKSGYAFMYPDYECGYRQPLLLFKQKIHERGGC